MRRMHKKGQALITIIGAVLGIIMSIILLRLFFNLFKALLPFIIALLIIYVVYELFVKKKTPEELVQPIKKSVGTGIKSYEALVKTIFLWVVVFIYIFVIGPYVPGPIDEAIVGLIALWIQTQIK